jgi:hypothetical protein
MFGVRACLSGGSARKMIVRAMVLGVFVQHHLPAFFSFGRLPPETQ